VEEDEEGVAFVFARFFGGIAQGATQFTSASSNPIKRTAMDRRKWFEPKKSTF
jgi:hypothetical protein